VLFVWPDLLDACAVFERCVLSAIGGMGVHYQGIPAAEIRAALVIARVPRARWLDVSADVSSMGRIAADAHNQRAKPS
jgi:hypothetical protein